MNFFFFCIFLTAADVKSRMIILCLSPITGHDRSRGWEDAYDKCHRIYDCGFVRNKCYSFLLLLAVVLCYEIILASITFGRLIPLFLFFSLFVKILAN